MKTKCDIPEYYTSGSGRIELKLTMAQAAMMSHQGACDSDAAYGRTIPAIKKQLDKLDPKLVASELSEYGAWDDAELADHQQNLTRLLWIAAGDILEESK